MTRPITRRHLLALASTLPVLAAAPSIAPAGGGLRLIMFEIKGCPTCAVWKREVGRVYHKTKQGRRAPLRRVNMHRVPKELSGIRGVRYSPTFVLVDARNREI
ncbi:MAG TPA: hypothetical protein ENK15_02265, partial [Thermopetrobacter sp.]|nr:hypothetical protein [Thermopetrobacter sp.]